MDSLVKQLQQVIPLKFQTMEIKFAPLQTVHLSRTFKTVTYSTLGGSSAVIPLPLANHSAFRVIERTMHGMDKMMEMSNNTWITNTSGASRKRQRFALDNKTSTNKLSHMLFSHYLQTPPAPSRLHPITTWNAGRQPITQRLSTNAQTPLLIPEKFSVIGRVWFLWTAPSTPMVNYFLPASNCQTLLPAVPNKFHFTSNFLIVSHFSH